MNLERRYNFFVGLFVIVGLLIFVGVIFITFQSKFMKKGYYLKVNYHNLGGLQEGDEITLGGYQVGHLDKIVMSCQPKVYFNLSLFIEEDVVIPKETITKIASKGLIGQKYIELIPPKESKGFLKQGDQLKSLEFEGDVLLAKAEEVADNFNLVAKDISAFFEANKLNLALDTVNKEAQEITTNFNQTLSTVNKEAQEITANFNLLTTEAKETFQLVQKNLIKIEQVIESFQQTTKDISQATEVVSGHKEEVTKVISQLDQNLILLSSVLVNLNEITSENKSQIKNILQNLEVTSKEVQGLAKDLKERPWRLIRKE
ncbi:MCE family protein [bacterium]|nr:MCE family protein [bacterium]